MEKLSDRIYICDECGYTIDRDYNVSMNLEALIATN
jgi:putative transposase